MTDSDLRNHIKDVLMEQMSHGGAFSGGATFGGVCKIKRRAPARRSIKRKSVRKCPAGTVRVCKSRSRKRSRCGRGVLVGGCENCGYGGGELDDDFDDDMGGVLVGGAKKKHRVTYNLDCLEKCRVKPRPPSFASQYKRYVDAGFGEVIPKSQWICSAKEARYRAKHNGEVPPGYMSKCVASSKKKANSPWIRFVKKFAADHNIPYRDALAEASLVYKKKSVKKGNGYY